MQEMDWDDQRYKQSFVSNDQSMLVIIITFMYFTINNELGRLASSTLNHKPALSLQSPCNSMFGFQSLTIPSSKNHKISLFVQPDIVFHSNGCLKAAAIGNGCDLLCTALFNSSRWHRPLAQDCCYFCLQFLSFLCAPAPAHAMLLSCTLPSLPPDFPGTRQRPLSHQ